MDNTSETDRFGESIGGNLCLDFANTVSWDPSDSSAGEKLHSYRDLVDWGRSRRVVSPAVHRWLVREGRRAPGGADDALATAIELRGHIHRLFESVAVHGTLSPPLLEPVNAALNRLPWRLAYSDGQTDWDWGIASGDLDGLLRPVVWEAAVLLRSEDLDRVRSCHGDRCGWLFIDRSRRGNRRWCDMRDCGNRAKAKRHYYRHRTK